LDLLREHIGSLVNEGFLRGYYPDWEIEYIGISNLEMSEYSFDHIADGIKQGFIGGDIQEDDKSGWWRLYIYETSDGCD